MVSKTRQKKAIELCKEWLKPGDVVYTGIRHVSRSGMSRRIRVFIIENDSPRDISYTVADVLGWKYSDRYEAITVSGCGMDMGFHLVYNLSYMLWPDGFECVGEGKCQANDHFNGDRDYTPHHHRDGGYALKQKWL